MVDAAEAPGSGAMEFPLPGLRSIDRTGREKTAHLPQPAGIGGQDEVRGTPWAELLDEVAKALAKLCIPHIARHRFLRGVAGKGGEKAMAREMTPHGSPMGDLIGLRFEVDRCGQKSCPQESCYSIALLGLRAIAILQEAPRGLPHAGTFPKRASKVLTFPDSDARETGLSGWP